jgi:hypothetical protein
MQKGGIKHVQIEENSDWEDPEVRGIVDHPSNHHFLRAELHEIGV